MGILSFAFLSEVYVIFHYGIIPPKNKGKYFVIIEINRFVLFYLMCFYYTDRASGLLKQRQVSKNVLSSLLLLGLVLITSFGLYLSFKIEEF